MRLNIIEYKIIAETIIYMVTQWKLKKFTKKYPRDADTACYYYRRLKINWNYEGWDTKTVIINYYKKYLLMTFMSISFYKKRVQDQASSLTLWRQTNGHTSNLLSHQQFFV